MSAALVPMLVESVVKLSTKVAVDGLVKIVTPPGVKAVSNFLIKGASLLIGGIVAHKLSAIVVKSVEGISATVKTMPEVITTVESPPKDN